MDGQNVPSSNWIGYRMTDEEKRKQRTRQIVMAYPLVLLLIGVVLNVFIFGVDSVAVALPSEACIFALMITAVLLVFNHTWLMTSTELTRVKFSMFETPEDRAASGVRQRDVPERGVRELERRHNTHRNTTENTVIFFLLALIFVLISPTVLAAQVWIVAFGVARLGYTYSYLTGSVQARGLFMSLGLLATYGIASYLVMSSLV